MIDLFYCTHVKAWHKCSSVKYSYYSRLLIKSTLVLLIFLYFHILAMTRGNQRDLAREKAAKKLGKGKSAADQAANAGLTLEQRKQRDADIMRQKQEKKAEEAAKKAKK